MAWKKNDDGKYVRTVRCSYCYELGHNRSTCPELKKYIDTGVEKIILGSAAIKDKNFLNEACHKFPNKIALGMDAKDGYLSVSGWKENSNQLTLDYLKESDKKFETKKLYL